MNIMHNNILQLQTQAPAVKALGSLFKFTQVFLWDDASVETQKEAPFSPLTNSVCEDETSSDTIFTTKAYSSQPSFLADRGPLSEDEELASQMSALGLPMSFQTNKQRRHGMIKGKRKDMNKKHLYSLRGTDDGVLDLIKVSEGEIASPTVFHDKTSDSLCCMSMLGQSESSCCGITVGINETQLLNVEEEDSTNLTVTVTCGAVKEQGCDGASRIMCYSLDCSSVNNNVLSEDKIKTAGSFPGSIMENVDICHHRKEQEFYSDIFIQKLQDPDVGACSQSSGVFDPDQTDSKYSCDLGDWTSYWDSYYMRNYFYNIKTHESTWDPPEGMEHLVLGERVENPEEMIGGIAEINLGPAVSFHHSEPVDSCGLQCDSDSLRGSKDCNKSQGQPSSEPLGRFELDSDNFHDFITVSTLNCGSVQLKETQGINKEDFCDENSLHLLSEHLASLGNGIKQLHCDEVCSKGEQITDMYRTEEEELECSGQLGNSDEIISCEVIESNCHGDDLFQPSDASSNAFIKALSEDKWNGNLLLGHKDPEIDSLETEHNFVYSKMKKKERKRTRLNRKFSSDSGELRFQGILEDFSPSIGKYWYQRYLLFSRFDDGIRMDEEGWFSVTPEPIASHHACRCGTGIIVDCFAGVGGNAIQFAQRSKYVIAIDIDPKKVDYAQHNAAIYGVNDHVEFVIGDFFLLAPRLKADTVFLSPPWGGPDYAKVTTYDLKTMLKPHDGLLLFNVARRIASKVVMFLPRNVDINQLAELSLSANPPWSLEVEKNFLNGKLKAVTAYFTDTSV